MIHKKMKIKVHISNRSHFLDPRVVALVEVPIIPRIGEYLYVSEDTRSTLERLAIGRIGWGSAYADWVNPQEPNRVNLKSAIRVVDVAYMEGSPYISIELDRG